MGPKQPVGYRAVPRGHGSEHRHCGVNYRYGYGVIWGYMGLGGPIGSVRGSYRVSNGVIGSVRGLWGMGPEQPVGYRAVPRGRGSEHCYCGINYGYGVL